MRLGVNNWVFVFCVTQLGWALTWNQEEQFIEGDFPYYPFNSRISFLRDGLTDARAIASEFSGSRTADAKRILHSNPLSPKPQNKRFIGDIRHPAAFYEFRNVCSPTQDGTVAGWGSSLGKTLKNLESKKLSKFWKKQSKTGKKSKEDVLDYDLDRIHHASKKKREDQEELVLVDFPGMRQMDPSAQRKSLFHNVSFPGIMAALGNLNVTAGQEDEQHIEKIRSGSNPGYWSDHPQEGSLEDGTAGLGRWLSGELEKHFRRKDKRPEKQRWLEFMKNAEEKSPGRVIITDTGKQLFAKHSGKCDWCNKKRMPWRRKQKGTLIDQIDALLADLSRFRATVRDESIKRRRDVRMQSHSGLNPRVLMRRLVRSAPLAPDVLRDGKYLESLKNDLRDLKNNIILYENNELDEPNRQAINDMKLHIKVYVEKNGDNNNEEQ